MLLCQISDPHLVAPGKLAAGGIDTAGMLARALAQIESLDPRPDALLVTGDLTDHGLPAEYGTLAELLATLSLPVYLLPGNHDRREALQAAFPRMPWLRGEDGFVQYAVEDFDVRLVVLDTVESGKPGGRLCARRLAWLDRTLAAAPGRATLVAQHHPPIATGMRRMDTMALANPADEEAVIARHPQVERVLCGHYHRPIVARFGGSIVSVCPSTGQQLALGLRPDDGIDLTGEPPSFQLHLVAGGRVVTHTVPVGTFPVERGSG